MSIIELGALASGLLAVITLSGKMVKLITTIQSLINRIEQLQIDMKTSKTHWENTTEKYEVFDQRLRLIELELAIV